MTLDDRIQAMKEFAERQDLGFSTWTGTQRDPGDGVCITFSPGVSVSVTSHDGLHVAVARMEAVLLRFKRAAPDAYLHSPHSQMGAVA